MRHACLPSVFALLLVPAFAAAGEQPPPSGVVMLTASATSEVAKDYLSVTLAVTREGPDAASVQTALKTALDAALAEARRAARPGQVEVRTGGFSLFPRTSPKGPITGWQGTAELGIEGRDLPAIAQLAGRIGTLSVARVQYGLSRELRDKTEGEITGQAIARFRAKAAEAAQSFGYAGYSIREVSVAAAEPGFPAAPMMRMSPAAAAAESAPLPVEAGRAAVTVTVSGSVQMLK